MSSIIKIKGKSKHKNVSVMTKAKIQILKLFASVSSRKYTFCGL